MPASGGIDLSLREAEQRQTRLGAGSELVRTRVRLVGGSEVAAPAANLADLVVAQCSDVALEVVELVARRHRDLLGCLEIAAESHHLRAVDAAGAGEAGHVEPVAPAIRSIRPFGGAAEVADVLA